jgi:zinc/manganese transport system permease protein
MSAADAVAFLALPFVAAVLFVLIHAWFGVNVLRRNVIFADLALAQLSALGATVAFALGYAPASVAGFTYAFLFTAFGAALLTASRRLVRHISQEAFVGILYVAATAVTILAVDRSPQGAEHVKAILIGSILTVGPDEVVKFALLYGAIGLCHFLARRPLGAISANPRPQGRGAIAVAAWDFFFFLSFGIVVTSSVATAGVLLVFSFLIVPAVIGSLFSRALAVVLPIAWGAGIAASALGLAGSFILDVSTGAAMVIAFTGVLVLAGLAKALVFVAPARRRRHWRAAGAATAAIMSLAVLASSIWLMANPQADQPLLAAFERATGLGPARFLGTAERETFESAVNDAARFAGEAARLDARERSARLDAPLADEEVRRIASYQQTFNEMARGERFVEGVLRGHARDRERWFVGAPAALLALGALALLARTFVRFAAPAASGNAASPAPRRTST